MEIRAQKATVCVYTWRNQDMGCWRLVAYVQTWRRKGIELWSTGGTTVGVAMWMREG